MATNPSVKPVNRQASTRTQMDVLLGKAEKPLGRLFFVKDGQREFSQFAYSEDWLADAQFFDVSPDLTRQSGYQLRKPPTKNDTCFFLALADTEPDYLACVDDFSRVGALRLRDERGCYLRSVADGARSTPVFLELEKILLASRAVEANQETAEDLAYLQGKGTSLGGMRPKCTILDSDGALSLGKFPSLNDERSVTRGEVLALRLAQLASIETAQGRVVMVQGQPVAMIRRFDRTPEHHRIPYISGATLLQANRDDEHSYTEIIDVMRTKCENFIQDARQLWRRLVFNHLITNVDDHLQNIGFLYCGNNQWRLAPAFDLNPFPDKDRESKTWLSEDSGPITSIQQLLDQAARFELSQPQAQSILEEVAAAVERWKDVATSAEVGLQTQELNDFRPAFESHNTSAAF
jgi:serine/threonine-protein kinase HipA